MNSQSPPKLDAPGAGLPPLEWAVAKFIIVPLYLGSTSPQQALERADQQCKSILKTARGISAADLSKQILIPRLPGLEDSSRYWSVAMTIQHLVIVNEGIAQIVVSLSKGNVPGKTASTAAVKPSPDVSPDTVLDEYENSMNVLLPQMREVDLNQFRATKYAHPWFGPLSARDWLLFIPFHQRVHEAQIKAIIKSL